MIKFIKDLRINEKGAAAAEYALILAIIGSAIALSAALFGDAIAAVFTRATTRMALITF